MRLMRVVIPAWGERYVRQLLDLTVPALLAPGNLPSFATPATCTLVAVTQSSAMPLIWKAPVTPVLRRYCNVLLVPMDDILGNAAAYGRTLTLSLLRGFSDLGPAMCDAHLMFLNTDFIVADGALGRLHDVLEIGYRLVLAPSYCVVSEEVTPRLMGQVKGSVLSVPPRKMASLALRYLHNTVRGKLVNDPAFSVEWIDQFYWRLDENTLLGRQLPIALVGMRPTRQLMGLDTFWDYGILSAACPNTQPHVLGDSDDFLMVELRGRDVAKEQLRVGRPAPREIAQNLAKFTTSDALQLAGEQLVLHSGSLPAEAAGSQRVLSAYVATVLHHLPRGEYDSQHHPIWDYHERASA